MIKQAKLREPDDELRVLAEAAEKKIDDAWDDGFVEGYNQAKWNEEVSYA